MLPRTRPHSPPLCWKVLSALRGCYNGTFAWVRLQGGGPVEEDAVAIVLEQFVQYLTQSGLMSAAEISSFQDGLPPDKRPKDGRSSGPRTGPAGKLTKYQAQAVYQGKIKGLVFGEYVVLDKLGEGGMGVVLKAQHRRMKRVVAVKMIARRSLKSPDAVKRFYREVEAAAKLEHPNIVTAYDASEHDGMHYLVMEYVEGKDLAAIVKEKGPLPVAAGGGVHHPGRPRPSICPRARHRPPRHQASQPAGGQERHGEDPRHGPGAGRGTGGRRRTRIA